MSTRENGVRAIVAKHLELPRARVQADASLVEDLGADSLALVQIVLALEERFEIDIPDGALEKMRTVRDLFAAVELARAS